MAKRKKPYRVPGRKDSAEVNRKYKDTLFRMLFGTEENKQNALLLYNALTDSELTDLSQLRIYTLEDAMYLSMKNDAAILVSDRVLHLWEHMSTINPNIPVRTLLYAAETLQKYVEETGQNIYSEKPVQIPAVRLFEFYNGRKQREAETILRLSDLMPPGLTADLDVTVKMININFDGRKELLRKCRPLYEYCWLVHKIRERYDNMKPKDKADKDKAAKRAVASAINKMPENFTIRKWLLKNRAGVVMSLLYEFDEKKYKSALLKEGFDEGFDKGKKQGISKGMKQEKRNNIRKVYEALCASGMKDQAVEFLSRSFSLSEPEIRKIISGNVRQR